MDDGPRPMKNMKPTQKNPNSAEQFRNAHKSVHDSGNMSEDRMKRVHEHNLAYPKLRDELDKRRSLKQVTINEKKISSFDPKCRACMKLKQLKKLRKLNIQPRCAAKSSKRKYQQERKSRVKRREKFEKRRTKMHGRESTSRKRNMNRCVELIDKDTGMDIEPLNNLLSSERIVGMQENSKNAARNPRKENSSTNSVNTLNNPNTSNFSMSSYNTYTSMDHEPMVSTD
ncbi:uncharacterized protein LOC124541676 [Vanessa cardui]|uniref:uncharacterized protein LOC124541676 n=1 Tax=Vanessa cardui TaxID=171605 RepID=UPI001F1290A5|nr:uncharacterized protein LOC124541676 [Vanessa cardui]